MRLPASPDWRWGRESSTSVWYPSMRLFRQQAMGGWTAVVREVQAELAKIGTGYDAL